MIERFVLLVPTLALLLASCIPPPAPAPPPPPLPTRPAAASPSPAPVRPSPAASPSPSPAAAPIRPSRYAAIVDAGQAFERGDYSAALRLYRAAADDPRLSDAPARHTRDPGPDLRAYARFQLVLTDVLVGQEDDALALVAEARERDAGSPPLALTETLWRNYTHTGSLQAACAEVVALVRADPGRYLEALNGYGDPPLQPEEVCRVQAR